MCNRRRHRHTYTSPVCGVCVWGGVCVWVGVSSGRGGCGVCVCVCRVVCVWSVCVGGFKIDIIIMCHILTSYCQPLEFPGYRPYSGARHLTG